MSEPIEKLNNVKMKPFRQRRKIIDTIIILSILVGFVFILITRERKPDPASVKIILEIAAAQLNKDPNELTDEDFATITELSFTKLVKYEGSMPVTYYSFYLSDIKFLEKFTNLQKLNLSGVNFPRDKMPEWMKLMDKFGNYNLWGRYSNEGKFEIDLSPLKKLPNLKELYLAGPFFNNIKPLSKVKNLECLYLYKCYNITIFEEEDLKKDLPNLKIVRVR